VTNRKETNELKHGPGGRSRIPESGWVRGLVQSAAERRKQDAMILEANARLLFSFDPSVVPG